MTGILRNLVKGLDRKLSCIVFGSTIGTYPYLKGALRWYLFLLKSNLSPSGFEKFRLLRSRDALLEILHHHRNSLSRSCFGQSDPKFVEVYDFNQLQDHSIPTIRYIDQVLEEIGQMLRPFLSDFHRSVLYVNIYSIQHTTNLKKLSADWHQDRRPINWLRIFILLHDTYDQHGPLSYIDQSTSSVIIRRGFRRGNAIDYPFLNSISLLTGFMGDALIINAETCLHKAGVPCQGLTRTIMEIVFKV